MREVDPSNHFHGVTICRRCALLEIAAVFRNEKEVREFFSGLEEALNNTAISMGEPDTKVSVEVLIPNEVARLTTGQTHDEGHDVIFVLHQCEEEYANCQKAFSAMMASRLAEKLMEMLRSKMEQPMTFSSELGPKETHDSPKNYNDRARQLLDSIDLPDDLFKGIN